jgi:DnaJ-class molecular chaperone
LANPEWTDPIDWEDDVEDDKCHLCHGTGQINALTNQDYIFVASYADCPLCDGSGVAQ